MVKMLKTVKTDFQDLVIDRIQAEHNRRLVQRKPNINKAISITPKTPQDMVDYVGLKNEKMKKIGVLI